MPSTTRHGYSAGKFLIELEGALVGAASSVEGGDFVGEVSRQAADPTGLVKKHIANVQVAPLTLTIGLGMGKELAGWVSAFTARTAAAKDGAIVFVDHDGRIRSRLEWWNGLITQVRFPGGDATDRSTGEITVTIEPERVTTSAGGGAQASIPPKTHKAWTRNTFRVHVDSVANDTMFASRVEEVVVSRAIAADPVGERRGVGPSYGPQEVSDVIITIPEDHGSEFAQWLDDFLVKGNNGDGSERSGMFEYLGPSLEELAALSFKHLGITRVARERTEAGNSVTARVKVHLYCEEVLFASGSTTETAPTTDPTNEALLSAARRLLADRDRRLFAAEVAGPGTTEAIAARLVATAADKGATTPPEEQDGFAIGQRWAAQRATLDEFAGLAQFEDPAWTAIILPKDHSLIADLRDAGMLPGGESGPVELRRGPLVEGIARGIAAIGDGIQGGAELGDANSLRLQAMLEAQDKVLSMLSNVLKQDSDTAAAITDNLK